MSSRIQKPLSCSLTLFWIPNKCDLLQGLLKPFEYGLSTSKRDGGSGWKQFESYHELEDIDLRGFIDYQTLYWYNVEGPYLLQCWI